MQQLQVIGPALQFLISAYHFSSSYNHIWIGIHHSCFRFCSGWLIDWSCFCCLPYLPRSLAITLYPGVTCGGDLTAPSQPPSSLSPPQPPLPRLKARVAAGCLGTGRCGHRGLFCSNCSLRFLLLKRWSTRGSGGPCPQTAYSFNCLPGCGTHNALLLLGAKVWDLGTLENS